MEIINAHDHARTSKDTQGVQITYPIQFRGKVATSGPHLGRRFVWIWGCIVGTVGGGRGRAGDSYQVLAVCWALHRQHCLVLSHSILSDTLQGNIISGKKPKLRDVMLLVGVSLFFYLLFTTNWTFMTEQKCLACHTRTPRRLLPFRPSKSGVDRISEGTYPRESVSLSHFPLDKLRSAWSEDLFTCKVILP